MKPYGLKSKDMDCCPGHTGWPLQSKHSNKTGGRRTGRRYLKKIARSIAKEETKKRLKDMDLGTSR